MLRSLHEILWLLANFSSFSILYETHYIRLVKKKSPPLTSRQFSQRKVERCTICWAGTVGLRKKRERPRVTWHCFARLGRQFVPWEKRKRGGERGVEKSGLLQPKRGQQVCVDLVHVLWYRTGLNILCTQIDVQRIACGAYLIKTCHHYWWIQVFVATHVDRPTTLLVRKWWKQLTPWISIRACCVFCYPDGHSNEWESFLDTAGIVSKGWCGTVIQPMSVFSLNLGCFTFANYYCRACM